jgi:hypothetical protein
MERSTRAVKPKNRSARHNVRPLSQGKGPDLSNGATPVLEVSDTMQNKICRRVSTKTRLCFSESQAMRLFFHL